MRMVAGRQEVMKRISLVSHWRARLIADLDVAGATATRAPGRQSAWLYRKKAGGGGLIQHLFIAVIGIAGQSWKKASDHAIYDGRGQGIEIIRSGRTGHVSNLQ